MEEAEREESIKSEKEDIDWKELMMKFCSICRLHFYFKPTIYWSSRCSKVYHQLVMEDDSKTSVILSGATYDAERKLMAFPRVNKCFVGRTPEIACKFFFETFLMLDISLSTTDDQVYHLAMGLKEFAGLSIEALMLKLDLS